MFFCLLLFIYFPFEKENCDLIALFICTHLRWFNTQWVSIINLIMYKHFQKCIKHNLQSTISHLRGCRRSLLDMYSITLPTTVIQGTGSGCCFDKRKMYTNIYFQIKFELIPAVHLALWHIVHFRHRGSALLSKARCQCIYCKTSVRTFANYVVLRLALESHRDFAVTQENSHLPLASSIQRGEMNDHVRIGLI